MSKNEITCRSNRALTSKRERLCTSRGVNVIEDLGGVAISILSQDHMGALRVPSWITPGEDYFRGLVSHPELVVARGIGKSVEAWAAEESRLVAAVAAAPDKPARTIVKLQIPALVPAAFAGLDRTTEACIARQVVGLDFDRVIATDFDGVVNVASGLLPGLFFALHTTASERNDDG